MTQDAVFETKPGMDTRTALWLASVHIIAVLALGYEIVYGSFHPNSYLLAAMLFICCQLSISCGVHLLYAHGAYKATKVLQYIFLFFFSGVFQGPAKWWARVHKQHHDFSDEDGDPHSPLREGLLYAHTGWILRKHLPTIPRKKSVAYLKMLKQYPLLDWQQRYHRQLAVTSGLVVPALIATLWDDPVGGLLIGGFVRLVFQYHFTWCINSVSHCWGKRDHGGTATNNHWLALFTVGEAYHATHHRYPVAMLGKSWYCLSPSKWLLTTCSFLGLASEVKYAPKS